MTLAYLASQSCAELRPAQPQLVLIFVPIRGYKYITQSRFAHFCPPPPLLRNTFTDWTCVCVRFMILHNKIYREKLICVMDCAIGICTTVRPQQTIDCPPPSMATAPLGSLRVMSTTYMAPKYYHPNHQLTAGLKVGCYYENYAFTTII